MSLRYFKLAEAMFELGAKVIVFGIRKLNKNELTTRCMLINLSALKRNKATIISSHRKASKFLLCFRESSIFRSTWVLTL